MKRDMDLARQILLAIEGQEDADGSSWFALEFEGVSDKSVSHHIRLLHEAGLLDAIDLSTMAGPEWRPKSLTWAGHEFLDAARDETLWNKAKALVISKTGSLGFEALKIALIEGVKAVM
ncbi:MAG: Uncharacterized protein JWQ90_3811 [Hydrocarboniphaga sp.]|uniref:DUF2513 domain-containing protein n=1 Tax=Hydrocarboniphaga sp. TaxID=2033016 RepID=UPI0026124584|nr:DUF2513 domain-containing protein [Hydrocarboniphaga sp.]MDB5971361.1 Uncharacterized protein [Hydrocarboniphaga sp.]